MLSLVRRAPGVGIVRLASAAAVTALQLVVGEHSFTDVASVGVLDAVAIGTIGVLTSVAGALRASGLARDELKIRLAQQSAVAGLGQLALTDVGDQELLDATVQTVRSELRTDLAGVLELMGEDDLVFRSASGWPKSALGVGIPRGLGSQGGYTLAAGCPVIMRDAARELRFEISPMFVEHAVRSGLSVSIGSNGGTYGILGAHTRGLREFSDDDVNFLSSVANVLASALRRRKAEDDAEKTHRVLEAVIEGTTDDVFVKDLEGRFVAVNARAANTLGLPKGELVGRRLDEVAPAELAEMMAETDRLIVARGTVETFEESFSVAGEDRVYLTTKGPYCAQDGRLLGTFGIAHDITARKAQEQALARSEERFRLAQEGARMGTWDVDLATGVTAWSAGLRMLLGVSDDAPAGLRGFLDVVHPEDGERVARIIRESRAAGKGFEIETRSVRPDGEVRWLLGRSSPVVGRDRDPVRMLGVAADITERKVVEEELVRSEETLRLAQAAAQLGAWDWDIVSDELRWTSGVYEIFGLDPTRYEPSHETMSEHIHEDDRAGFDDEVRRALASDSSYYEQPCRIVQPSGEIRWVINRGTIVRGDDGVAKRLIGITLDDTERKRVEARLRQAERLEAIGQLAGGVAHDFNNLLVAIRGYGELALGKLTREEHGVAHDIEAVLSAADSAAGLTKQLLAFGRRQVLTPTVLDLNEIVRDTTSLLQRLIGDNVELVLRLGSRPVIVKADRGQLEQVITNLAVNGGDAMPDGGVLTIQVTSTKGTGLIIVTDGGQGIDAVTAGRIFDPFFTTKGEKGTGLGLATVHGIVAQSGGQISVDSEPGHGASFTVRLPLSRDELERPDEAEAPRNDHGTETILVVEDDPSVRTVVATMLESRGYEIVGAADGEDAIGRFRDEDCTISLVVSDLMMGSLGGRETIERIRRLAPTTKVLYMSGYSDDSSTLTCELTPETGFIQKPFSGDELATRVRDLLDKPE
jgi:two-component system cell cycle sensor histidine kinase/response regulator CckA